MEEQLLFQTRSHFKSRFQASVKLQALQDFVTLRFYPDKECCVNARWQSQGSDAHDPEGH